MEPLVSTTLNVERLTQNGPIKSTVQIDLPLDTPFADLAPRIRPNVDLAPADISVSLASKISVLVTDGPSNHNPTMSEGLKINFNEPLVSWYKAYRRTVGLAPQATNSSDSEIRYTGILNVNQDGSTLYQQNDLITVGAATFTFNRTLRVPDDAKSYALPPALGTLPWVKAQNYSSSLPEYIAQRGGYIMPLFQREAMWIRIYGDTCAIKISVGGINAITGHKQDEEPPKGIQDYVVGGRQPWLDGIAVESGVVRQFRKWRHPNRCFSFFVGSCTFRSRWRP
ncbi:hypothetical protein DL96DRAFT_505647 [Flagelloscypha sp. PMI_526]|nr:hypothetical protein DL96DRAFT_505647 [Flagelloscypha sp. PMI_526]